jgi:predicted ArsR family transcriptional regulator
MTHQLTFDEIRRARTDDPATSKDAARQSHGLASEHRRQILAALEGGVELTAGEIAVRCGLTSLQVSRRMAELRSDGEIVATTNTRPTPSGRPAQVWRRA